jgi:SAM-dependent methyltransferase
MRCIICEQEQEIKLFSGFDLLHKKQVAYNIYQCEICKLARLENPPAVEELANYYPEDYISFSKSIDDEKNIIRKLDRNFGIKKRANRVIQVTNEKGKILDIGCATGLFLNEMKKNGWEIYGIEPSTYAANYARDTYNINVNNSTLDQNTFPDSFFDVITMWDVLEHVPDPIVALTEIWRLLKPEGYFIASMPNTNAWEKRIFGKYWAGWDIPRHTFIFNDNNIKLLLQNTGFKIENISSFTGRHGVLALCIKFWLNSTNISNSTRNNLYNIAKSIPSRIITYPYYFIADRLNRSSIMTVFSRKDIH